MQEMTHTRTGRRRTLLALGMLAGVGLLATSAALTETRESYAAFDGRKNTFDLVAAGSTEPGWTPASGDWKQGAQGAIEIPLSDLAEGLVPGGSADVHVAVKNNSPRIAGNVVVDILDPLDRTPQLDPVTGTFVDLFPALQFSVWDGGTLVLERASGAALAGIPLTGELAAGEHRELVVEVHLPGDLDNQWNGATTDVQFRFEGENV